jgi:hypothetical protein
MSVHLLLTAPAAAHVPVAAGYVLGVGRTVPSAAAVVGLAGAVLGALALARPARRTARTMAIVALGLAVVSVVVGGVHAANSAGGLGTGNGLAGAVVAVVLGLVGLVLGGLAAARSRRTATAAGPGGGAG